jgi:hypothetical protein
MEARHFSPSFHEQIEETMSIDLKSEVVELVAQFQAQLKAGETDLVLQDLDDHYRQVFLWSEQATTEGEHIQRLKKLRDAIARRQKVYVVTITYTTVESSSENALNNGTGFWTTGGMMIETTTLSSRLRNSSWRRNDRHR